MVKKGSLFQLIKSLDKTEKRHFKIFANTNKENSVSILLFDAIEAQLEYDEDAIKEHFKGRAFVKQIHVAKIYLFELILKSLRNYHSNNSVTSQILDIIKDSEVLFKKELYNASYLKILKAENLAVKYEKFPLLIEILNWKRKIAVLIHPNKEIINEILKHESEILHQQIKLNEYCYQTHNLFDFLEQKDFLENLKTTKSSSIQVYTLKQHLLYTGYFIKGNHELANKEITDLLKKFEENPELISEDPGPYITTLGNKISLLINQHKLKSTESIIKKMREVPIKYNLVGTNPITVKLWMRIFNLELEIYRDTKQLNKGIELISEVEDYLEIYKANIPDDYRIMLYYQFASVYFLNMNYSKSLQWVNSILNSNFGSVRIDLQCYARLLNLMIHYELNNLQILKYLCDSCKRFIIKKKLKSDLDKLVLKLFLRLSQTTDLERIDLFNSTLNELRLNSDFLNEISDYLDFEKWIKDKIKYHSLKVI